MTVERGGSVTVVRDDKPPPQHRTEQVDLGPDSLVAYEARRQSAAAKSLADAVSSTEPVPVQSRSAYCIQSLLRRLNR